MKKDKTAVLDRIRKRISPEQREFVQMNLSIATQINYILKKKGWSQKEFAKRLDKKESEVSRYLSGLHNISLKSLAKIKVVLKEEILITPLEACERYKSFVFIPLEQHAKVNKQQAIKYPDNKNIEVIYRRQTTTKVA